MSLILNQVHNPRNIQRNIRIVVSVRRGENSLNLSKGEILRVRVIDSYGDGKYALLLKDKRVEAFSKVPLTRGSVINLKVTQSHPYIILNYVPNSKALNRTVILNGLYGNIWSNLLKLEYLKDTLNKLFKVLIEKGDRDILYYIIDGLGLRYEFKIKKFLSSIKNRDYFRKEFHHDLKYIISKYLNDKDPETFKNYLSFIRNLNILNYKLITYNHKIIIPVPIIFPPDLIKVGQLLIHKEKDEKGAIDGEDKRVKIEFFIELLPSEYLKAIFYVDRKDIKAYLYTNSFRLEELLKQEVVSLIENMSNIDYNLSEIKIERFKDINPIVEEVLNLLEDGLHLVI